MLRAALPIDDVLPQIVESLSSAGALVLKAPPGAGKTTRVPPALLKAGLGDLDNKLPGQIVVLQPRRVAARAAAMRIAEELGAEIGKLVGYQVRHEARFSEQTRILTCTEGVFLRKLQDDPLLENIAVVVFDEFHERSLDSDLALAMARQVRDDVRPDLRLLVMSATLDCAPIARYLRGCPAVESVGRTFPVDIEYLQFPANAPIDRLVVDGITDVMQQTHGHILAFLPGVGEIRQVHALLEGRSDLHDTLVMPLYGDLPLEEQQRVLQPSKQRKIVLATNVAETSLTIDGVTGVVDSGYARVNRLDAQLGLNRLELSRISQASANQRAGRAGRTAPGKCLRLWTEREHQMFSEFDQPEIARVELSGCALQLLAWGERDIRSFGWFEQPPGAALDRALELLDRLDALDNGLLTELGQRMAWFPLQPRLSRLLVEGERFGQEKRAALCASLLAERDPFRHQESRYKSEHHTDSDVIDRLSSLEEYARTGRRDSIVGNIIPGAAKQIIRAATQLFRLTGQPANSRKALNAESPEEPGKTAVEPAGSRDSDQAMMRALLAAFPDRVCRRREAKGRRALMVGGRGVRLADESAVMESELFVAVEVADSGQSESLVRQASSIHREWLPQTHLTTTIDVGYDETRAKVMALKRTRFCDLVIEESTAALPADIDASSILAESVLTHVDLSTLVDEAAQQYLARVQFLRESMPECNLPDFGTEPWRELLPEWCMGCSSVSDLRSKSPTSAIQARLTPQQLALIEREAPESIGVPSGRKIKLDYSPGHPPILAVRIQELFGMNETPRIAGARVPVLLHLLAPNYRVQQITPDLASFWKNTYSDVKKELRRRYPKHAWPDNPLTAQAERGPQRRKQDP